MKTKFGHECLCQIINNSQKVEVIQGPQLIKRFFNRWHVYTKEYLIIKRNEVLVDVMTWVNLENIVPSEKVSHKSHALYESINIKYPE